MLGFNVYEIDKESQDSRIWMVAEEKGVDDIVWKVFRVRNEDYKLILIVLSD